MKKEIGAVNSLYPTTTTIVGANVDGIPNYSAIAWVGIMGRNKISLCINKKHYTNQGIKGNKTFSINIPSENLVKETDYVGIKSGREVNKGKLFKTFYGKLETAPMIEECAVNMECKLIDMVDTATHDIFIGEVASTYCEDSLIVEGRINIGLVKPILFSMLDRGYWRLGERFADAWSIGKELEF
jgi:flavin reductase (DIM6/NTAB) family NADH-FMN oxidoreductase RutF